MSEFCTICGAELVEGVCPNAATHIKKMCLNCPSCEMNEDGTYVCNNEANMNKALEKVRAALPGGYEFESLSLKPLALKDPTKKCGQWSLCTERILVELQKLMA